MSAVGGAGDATVAYGKSMMSNTRSSNQSSSVDPTQAAVAIQTIRVATNNMKQQFAAFQRVLDVSG